MDIGLEAPDSPEKVEVDFLQPAQAFSQLQTILQNINIPYQKVKTEVMCMTELRANCAAGLDMAEVSYDQVANNLRLPKELTAELLKKRQLIIQSEKFLNQYMGNNIDMKVLSEFNHYLEVGGGNGASQHNENTLFSSVPATIHQTCDELEELFETLYQKTRYGDVIARSWKLHYAIIKHAHFFKRRAMVARLLQYSYLKQHNMHLYGLLALEESLLSQKETYNDIIVKIDRGEDVLSDLIQLGLHVHSDALENTQERIKNLYRLEINYKKLAPWQRNISNYMFNRGFDLKLADDGMELNQRQSDILQTILVEGYVSTKDMVEKFECNRKTIQRDFAELLDANLVRAIGKGAALKYGLSLKDKPNNSLEKYQTISLDDSLLKARISKPTAKKQKRLDDDQALSQAS